MSYFLSSDQELLLIGVTPPRATTRRPFAPNSLTTYKYFMLFFLKRKVNDE